MRPRAVLLLAEDFAVQEPDDPERQNTWIPLLNISPTWDFLSDLQSRLMRQRNSLVLLAEALVEAQASVERPRGPNDPGPHA